MANIGTIENPKFVDLEKELVKLSVPKGYYSLGREQNERTCILKDDSGWIVFFAERGNRADIHRFSDFDDAQKYMLSILSS